MRDYGIRLTVQADGMCPHIEGTSIAVRDISRQFRAGESVCDIASEHNLTPESIEDALRFWMLPKRRQGKALKP